MQLGHTDLFLDRALLQALLLDIQHGLVKVLLGLGELSRDGKGACNIRGVVCVFTAGIDEDELCGC